MSVWPRLALLFVAFVSSLALLFLSLYIYGAHSDVQSYPYDGMEHKATMNRVSDLELYSPFALFILFVLARGYTGAALVLPVCALSGIRLLRHQTRWESNTPPVRVRLEERLSIVRALLYFLAWTYTLVKIIVIAVRD